MSRSDIDRLHHARSHANAATNLVQEHGIDVVLNDRDYRQSAVFDLIVIGETLSRVSMDVRSLDPEIPWRQLSDTRNRLIHAYWQIDVSVLKDFLMRNLPDLIRSLDRLIDTLEGGL